MEWDMSLVSHHQKVLSVKLAKALRGHQLHFNASATHILLIAVYIQ